MPARGFGRTRESRPREIRGRADSIQSAGTWGVRRRRRQVQANSWTALAYCDKRPLLSPAGICAAASPVTHSRQYASGQSLSVLTCMFANGCAKPPTKSPRELILSNKMSTEVCQLLKHRNRRGLPVWFSAWTQVPAMNGVHLSAIREPSACKPI